MPISVGEVNATLRFNILADQLATAKADLKTLIEQFNFLGGAAGSNAQFIQRWMQQAQQSVLALEAQVQEANQGFSTLDLIATRMIERFLIFQGIRLLVTFVKDLYESANAMEQLSERTQISIEALEAFNRLAIRSGEATKNFDEAIVHLHDNILKMNKETIEALRDMGITLDQLFSATPQQRIEGILGALSDVKDKTERLRLELELLGTDAFDRAIQNIDQTFKGLKDSVPDTETIQAMAAIDKAFKLMIEDVKEIGTTAVVVGQNWVKALNEPIFALISGGVPAFLESIRERLVKLGALSPLKVDIELFKDGAKIAPDAPLFGEEFVESMENRFTAELDPVIADRLQRLKDVNALTEASAIRAGASAEEYKRWTEEVKGNSAALTEHDALLMREFRTMETINAGIIRDNELRRQSEEVLIQTMRVRSVLTDEEIKVRQQVDEAALLEARIADLRRELEIEKNVFEIKFKALETERDRKLIEEEYARTVEKINAQIIQDQTRINELKLKEAEIIRQIAKANAEAVGQTLEGTPSDKNLNAADVAERHFEQTMKNADTQLQAGLITQKDYDEVLKAAVRAFNDEVNAANQVTNANKDLANSTKPLIDANKAAAAAAEEFVKSMEIAGGFHLPKFSLDRPFYDPYVTSTATTSILNTTTGHNVNVKMEVAGIWDPATVDKMATQVGNALIQTSNRQFPAR